VLHSTDGLFWDKLHALKAKKFGHPAPHIIHYPQPIIHHPPPVYHAPIVHHPPPVFHPPVQYHPLPIHHPCRRSADASKNVPVDKEIIKTE
jgi:hypothetical protein